MSRMAFLTRVLARSHDVPPSLSSARLRRAAVLLDEIEPLDRNEQLVFAGIAQLHELLHGVADADLLEPDEPPDAVIDVDDQVVDLEIAQVREERLRNRPVPVALALDLRALLLEDVRLGDDLQLGARQPEAFRELADGDVHGDVQQLVGAIDQDAAEAVLGEQLGRALGAPFGAGDEQHGVAALAHALDLGDPFLNAAAKFDGGLTGDVYVIGCADASGRDAVAGLAFSRQLSPIAS